ncbi:hypothetical protein V6615_16500 (plasmid) [Oscillospiraceae bacterium PP1C4]
MKKEDICMIGVPTQKYNFTPEQEKLVEDNYEIIFRWLKKHGYPVEEYFDVVIWGFLDAVKKYDPLHPKANLTTFLIGGIKYSLARHKSYISADHRSALNEYFSFQTYSNNNDNDDCANYFEWDREFDLFETVENRSMLEEIFSICSPAQREYCKLLILGYTVPEIAELLDQRYWTVLKEIKEMRIKLRGYFDVPEVEKDKGLHLSSVYCPFCGKYKTVVTNRAQRSYGISYTFQCKSCRKIISIPLSILKNKKSIKKHLDMMYNPLISK